MARTLKLTQFKHLSLDDPFFDSLKAGYKEFPEWFASKADDDVYVAVDGNTLSGMIYLKSETGPITDVSPPLEDRHWLKVGTLKIDKRGTKLGERVLKKIFDHALASSADGVYVTVFEMHEGLIRLFERYGFTRAATKTTPNGVELVLVRYLNVLSGDLLKDYPFIHTEGRKAWLLAIYPEYHTRLLPDSILRNEPKEIVQDVSHTNTIHKVYIGRLWLSRMSRGDVVLFYRTSDGKAPAHYRSVVTSVCVVEEVRSRKDFPTVDSFLAYTRPSSVFTEEELRERYFGWSRLFVVKMTYNVAFNKKTTRGHLIDEGIVSVQPRWDFRELTMGQMHAILKAGDVNARVIVD